MHININGQSVPIHEVGTQTYWSVLCPASLVFFAVPDHALFELLETDEWVAFRNLLEKYQEEGLQKRRQAEQERLEKQHCKEIYDQQQKSRENVGTMKRIVDKVRNWLSLYF